jgi:hypothetical protein
MGSEHRASFEQMARAALPSSDAKGRNAQSFEPPGGIVAWLQNTERSPHPAGVEPLQEVPKIYGTTRWDQMVTDMDDVEWPTSTLRTHEDSCILSEQAFQG